MSLSRVKTWSVGEDLNASDLNAEFDNILNNPASLVFPVVANITWKSSTSFTATFDHNNAADRTYTFPDATTTIVGTDTTQTLTNKTITSPSIEMTDLGLTINNVSSPTKQMRFSAASITAGQLRTFTMPDESVEVAGTERGAWTPADGSGAALSFSSVSGHYERVGKKMTIWGRLTYPVTANGSAAIISGLPATAKNTAPNGGGALSYTDRTTGNPLVRTLENTATVFLYLAGIGATNANMSTFTIDFSATYFIT